MANEIQFQHISTGKNLYAIVTNQAGLHYNSDGTGPETKVVANWDNYDIPMSETPASSYTYAVTFPVAAAGIYVIMIFERIGANPAVSDPMVGQDSYWDWNGSAHVGRIDVGMILGDVQSATDLKDFVDTGYDSNAHKVQGVVLTDTVTTSTNAQALITSSHSTTDALITSSHSTSDVLITSSHNTTDALITSSHNTTDALITSSHTITDALITVETVSIAGIWSYPDRTLTAETE